ncbi:hypothetical protein [Altericroceibacterium xinjiangense]|nr:hypothetical protein [Altericroceibacterium xinjiangense]
MSEGRFRARPIRLEMTVYGAQADIPASLHMERPSKPGTLLAIVVPAS